ncbi:hypothetical protein T4E_1104, partial [Trichinella pseudospiralis]
LLFEDMDTSSGYSKHFFSFWNMNNRYVYQFMKYTKSSDNDTTEQDDRTIDIADPLPSEDTINSAITRSSFIKLDVAELNAGLDGVSFQENEGSTWHLSRKPHHIRCGKCKRILVAEKERITLYPLPSPEVFDLWEDCFCSQTNQQECFRLFPTPSCFNCYVGRLFFVMDVDNLQNNFDILARRQPVMKCSFCKQDFGILKDKR